jgi:hypothetical protein
VTMEHTDANSRSVLSPVIFAGAPATVVMAPVGAYL